MGIKIEGFYEGETLEERLLRLTKEWETFEDDRRCDCASHAYDHCVEDIKHILLAMEKSQRELNGH